MRWLYPSEIVSAPGSTRKVIAAGAIGNVLEWYDFGIYGYFAAAIGRNFFPGADPVAQLLSAFGIFAMGMLMRPVGGILIGYLADRLGRRAALVFSVTAMAVPTFLIGALPGYQAIGVAAPVLLTLLRVVQGLAVGGEYPTSIVFMVEQAPPGRRAVLGAFACCAANGGILLGSATGAVLSALLPPDALADWGWRIPFLMGLVVGVAGYVLRRQIPQPARNAVARRSPLLEAMRGHRPTLARLAGVTVFNAVGFYLTFLYVASWLQFADGVAPARALAINTISIMTLLPTTLAMAWLSDRIGRKPLLLGATAIAFAGAWPLFWMMHHGGPVLILLGQLGFVLTVGMYLGAQPAAMVEMPPEAVRCTTIALGYNVPFGVIAGLTPLAATWLVHRTGNDLSPAFMVMAAAAVSFATVLCLRESYKDALEAA